jgi:hypothetical protein
MVQSAPLETQVRASLLQWEGDGGQIGWCAVGQRGETGLIVNLGA